MQVPTITMNQQAALEKLTAYRKQLRIRADAEYEAAAAGYKALSEGTPLLNLADAFAAVPRFPSGLPKLAIARADRKQVRCDIERGRFEFNALAKGWRSGYTGSLRIEVNAPYLTSASYTHGFALVPMVPADVRPSGPLSDYFILWEVEAWAETRIRATPDRDPYLLKRVLGDLYAIVAAWDLTDLERSIMSGRRDS